MRHAVILAGGGGTRLWPMSTRVRPKQFLELGTERSLLAATAARCHQLAGDQLWIVTTAEQTGQVEQALPDLRSGHVIAEPAARGTGPAIGLATAVIAGKDDDAVLGFLPADHHISDEAAFVAACDRAYECAREKNAIVTVGVVPTGPETGYGYLLTSGDDGPRAVTQFVEKPDQARAETYIQSGALWNAGMFFAPAGVLLREFETHMPETGKVLAAIRETARTQGRLAAFEQANSSYPNLQALSFDYGVMEHCKGVWTVPGDFGWSDIGSWASIPSFHSADDNSNVELGEVVSIDCSGTVAISDGGLIAALGVKDLVIVKSGSSVLVTKKEHAERVRELVAELEGNLDRYR
ncbi:MAG: NTP transferase domain-containing protein [Deltaproteobacteria bacterium]|nr:NTP transferase domain-containing protein [Deltaproteobacteria bacterium]